MRIISTLTLMFAVRVVAQTASTKPDADSELSTWTISTQSNLLVSDTPTPTISDPGITEITTSTSTSTTLPPTGTSPPPHWRWGDVCPILFGRSCVPGWV
ncbi:hypothetical protein RSOL_424450 [Rhizoctonia solani AG-3 Rhs1AP]|uniref:Transmembrane protein n=1 Tax=Rhizoctonia solani AG-3 Rhs1AP TaxID=1086054 RepID=X8JG12_9AGAM|nr:hypothetical protein RSOL_424450 [Rhizoctonia solani AG-3 Rhs1AP]